jgi:hypothetical protein
VLAIDRNQLTIGPFHLTDQLDQVSHRVIVKMFQIDQSAS